jgi:transglutaminase-like putative cysteine protease
LFSIPNAYVAVLSFRILTDLVVLALGELSLLQIVKADLWAITIAPAPVFGTWYLLLRRHYDLAAWAGGLTLGFFILTGAASEAIALIGVTSALAVLGLGTLDHSEASWEQIRDLGILLAVVVVITRLAKPVTASVFSSSGKSPLANGSGSSHTPTIEGSLLNAPGRIEILGSISLSPEVRFTVTADRPEFWYEAAYDRFTVTTDRPAFWHVAAYDRFTGEGWVRSGKATDYSEALLTPPGDSQTIQQTFEAKTSIITMPAAWKPVRVDSDIASRTRVTTHGGLQPTRSFSDGESYSVTSERPVWTESELREADEDIPAAIQRRYLQLPTSTPERVRRFAADLTADTETQFEKAAVIEQWLEGNKEYSLEVTRPDGNIADAFIFEMEQGYCVYYATAMTVMLRTLDIPARFTVGYSTGQQVGENEWVIRGFNSHAWVEVYFSDVGWVTFNPTPSGPRQAARQRRLQQARQSNAAGGDTSQTQPTTDTSPTTATPSATPATNETTATANQSSDQQQGAVVSDEPTSPRTLTSSGQDGQISTGVSRRSLFTNLTGSDEVALIAGIVGLTLGVSKFQLLKRGLRFAELHWQPSTGNPREDIKRAFVRVETVLGTRYRERRDGETRREYINTIQQTTHQDAQLTRLLQIYERAIYKGDVSQERANEARTIATNIIRQGSRVPKSITE